jgi:hypothetical protein
MCISNRFALLWAAVLPLSVSCAPRREAGIESFTVSPATIQAGGSSIVSWQTAGTSFCAVSAGSVDMNGNYAGGVRVATGVTGALAVSPTGTTTYELQCVEAGDLGAMNYALATINVQ